MDFLIISDDSVMARTYHMYRDIMCAPYPSPYIITDIVSRVFPELPQSQIYKLTQQIKQSIAQAQEIAALQIDLDNQSASRN